MIMIEVATEIILESWLVLGQMAPYLLFGFLMAGALSVCISPELVERHLGGRGLGPVLKASLFGIPLPLCSCSVIPVSASIRRHGASRSATTAFLLSTPQTGVDSIAVTYAMLGPVFAVFRAVAALLTGLLGGGLVQVFDRDEPGGETDDASSQGCTEACCAEDPQQNILTRILHYGLVVLPRDIGLALLLGVAIAGAMAAFIEPGQWEAYVGGGIGSILLLMAVGVPFYVCATASVPIAAGLMHIGASPGAALAFLIAGPATNAATFTTIWKLLGRRSAALYMTTVAVSAVACGLALNYLIPLFPAMQPELGSHAHHADESGWFANVAAVALLLVVAWSYRNNATAGKLSESSPEPTDPQPTDQQRLELQIDGMTCGHCADTVRRALAGCHGVRHAEVDFRGDRATVTGEQIDRQQLIDAATALGYDTKILDEGTP